METKKKVEREKTLKFSKGSEIIDKLVFSFNLV